MWVRGRIVRVSFVVCSIFAIFFAIIANVSDLYVDLFLVL